MVFVLLSSLYSVGTVNSVRRRQASLSPPQGFHIKAVRDPYMSSAGVVSCAHFASYCFLYMPELKDVLQRIRVTKQEKRKLAASFRDVLAQSKSYQAILDQMKEIKVKKLRLETEMRQEFVREMEKVNKLSESLKTDAQLLSDMALTKFMKGESIEVVDENDVKYEPVFKVTFKKTN